VTDTNFKNQKRTKPKDPLLTIALNNVLWGLGHFYAGAITRAKIILAVAMSFTFIFFAWALHPEADLKFLSGILNPEQNVDGIMWAVLLLLTLFIGIDGYMQAKAYNDKHHLERKPSGGKKILLIIGIVVTLFVLNSSFLLAIFSRNFVIQGFKIPSQTMAPTIRKNERFLVSKLAYRHQEPERGEIIAFMNPQDLSKVFIQRIVAKGGETVEIRQSNLYVNDDLIEFPAIKSVNYENRGEYGQPGQKVNVPDGHFFLLGDNSGKSYDSRFWGFVPKGHIIGKGYKIYFPFDRSGSLNTGIRSDGPELNNNWGVSLFIIILGSLIIVLVGFKLIELFSARDDNSVSSTHGHKMLSELSAEEHVLHDQMKGESMIETALFAGFLSAHAILSVFDGETLTPIYGYINQNNEKTIERLTSDSLVAGVKAGQEKLNLNPYNARLAVLIYDGRITIETGKIDALIVEARSYGGHGSFIIMAIPYSPSKILKEFSIHKVQIMDMSEHLKNDVEELMNKFFDGAKEHEDGAKVWTQHLDKT